MKNNQRSIDGFTPRRPIQNKIEKNMEDKKVDSAENKKINRKNRHRGTPPRAGR